MKFAKNGDFVEVATEIQASAFIRAGWVEVKESEVATSEPKTTKRKNKKETE